MTQGLERRDFIRGVAVTGAVASVAALPERPALAQTNPGAKPMTYEIKPLAFDPKSIKGLSEKLLVSHYENNYGGAVKRLNAITAQLAELDFGKVPVFMINGLKREELIAMNSMILHEIYFDGLGESGGDDPGGPSPPRLSAISAASRAGAPSSSPWPRRKAAARAGRC